MRLPHSKQSGIIPELFTQRRKDYFDRIYRIYRILAKQQKRIEKSLAARQKGDTVEVNLAERLRCGRR